MKALGQANVLREREISRVRRRPKAVANGLIADRAQLEAVHGVAVRVHPLESLKAGVPAGLSWYDVGQLNAGAIANSRRVAKIRDTSDHGRVRSTAGYADDGPHFPGSEGIADDPLHALQGGSVVNHVGGKNVRPVDCSQSITSMQV